MTLVTSLILQRNGRTTHTLEKYLNNFRYLKQLETDIVLFLDKDISIDLPKNIHVIKTNIKELESFSILNEDKRKVTQGIGSSYNPTKNTLDYMIIQNAKNELLYKAVNNFNLNSAAWIDFGAAHMFKTPELTIKKILNISKLRNGIVIPGCWDKNQDLSNINWRFCGTFLHGDKQSINNLYYKSYEALRLLDDLATWEVNIWAWMELNLSFEFLWYKANHDDSLFDFDQFFI